MVKKRASFCRCLIAAVLAFGLFFPARLFAQQFDFSKELKFAQYLQEKELPSEALYVLLHIDTTHLTRAQKDSLFYQAGWAGYSSQKLDTSARYLNMVSPVYPLYNKSRFFAAYDKAFLGKADTASVLLEALPLTDSIALELRYLQLAGFSLLRRDYTAFRSYQSHFTYQSYIDSKEEQWMQLYYDKLHGFRHKSPVAAGLLSAVVPGLGKYYAGKKRQAIAAFLPVISLAALTYEAYRKDGVKSARFIGFGSIFSIFYIGNIWGSVLSVKIKQNEFNKEYENKILFDLHIPLRNFFN